MSAKYSRSRRRRPTNAFLEGGRQSSSSNRPQKRRVPFGVFIAVDIVVAVIILLFFYLNGYVWEKKINAETLVTQTPDAQQTVEDVQNTPATQQDDTADDASQTPEKTDEAQQTPQVDMTIWSNKFADKFTDGEVLQTEDSYKSANVSVEMTRYESDGVVYFVADIYLTDIKYFKTAFGENKTSGREFVDDNLVNNNGIVGINGDNCWNNPSLLIRNGVYYDLYSSSNADQLVMYMDGSMETISGSDFDFDEIKEKAPYQVWGFGPMLLDSGGQPMSEFNSTVAGRANPHTAVGYFEPGHYCFVVVDGRRPDDYSAGMTMAELSKLMYDLGCKVAFNLDGGDTSQMAFMDSYYNIPSGSRKADDMIYITDSEE